MTPGFKPFAINVAEKFVALGGIWKGTEMSARIVFGGVAVVFTFDSDGSLPHCCLVRKLASFLALSKKS